MNLYNLYIISQLFIRFNIFSRNLVLFGSISSWYIQAAGLPDRNTRIISLCKNNLTKTSRQCRKFRRKVQRRNLKQGECYPELGCFPTYSPFTTLTRPFPPPQTPKQIQTKIYHYSRDDLLGTEVNLWPLLSLFGTDYKYYRTYTAFITHGWMGDKREPWIAELMNSILQWGNYNIFRVDWSVGAAQHYLQAATNTRIVGAEIARFCNYLINNGLNPNTIHLIGFGLGGHVMGYAGKGILNTKILRITALDPAQPGFEDENPLVRLDKSDALFVDVIHTDAKPFIPFLGFGMMQPVGHVDFYLNDGTEQPGCPVMWSAPRARFNTLSDLVKVPGLFVLNMIACAHFKAVEYFLYSIKLHRCLMWGRKVMQPLDFLNLTINANELGTYENCGRDNCSVMGLKTFDLPARGVYAVYTTPHIPFCDTPRSVHTKLLADLLGIYRKPMVTFFPW